MSSYGAPLPDQSQMFQQGGGSRGGGGGYRGGGGGKGGGRFNDAPMSTYESDFRALHGVAPPRGKQPKYDRVTGDRLPD